MNTTEKERRLIELNWNPNAATIGCKRGTGSQPMVKTGRADAPGMFHYPQQVLDREREFERKRLTNTHVQVKFFESESKLHCRLCIDTREGAGCPRRQTAE